MGHVMSRQTLITSDGCKLHYIKHGPQDGKLVVCLHGWSGSHRSFDPIVEPLLRHGGIKLVLVDQRFHGDSDKPDWGIHVHRLAADLKELLEALGGKKATVIGTGNLKDDLGAFADGNVTFCSNKELPATLTDVLRAETLKCCPVQLGKLMADHTQIDHRATLRQISVPCLNIYGGASKVFPKEGCESLALSITNCQNVCYEECNHWLYMEEPERFADDVRAFVKRI